MILSDRDIKEKINQGRIIMTDIRVASLQYFIRLQFPYVHILNLLQIIAMKAHDEKLLKETLVGIACGMLTTG